MFRQCLLCYLSGLLPVMANGQTHRSDTITDRTHQLREVTITESRRQHVVTSTAPLHILDRQQMLSLGVTDVADALHRIPGVTLRDYGGAGGMKTVSVRGFGAKHTGVSYDGVMLSDCQSGEIDLSRYSLENVDHLSLVIGDNDDIFIPARNASTPALLNIQTIGLPSDDTSPHLIAQMKTGSFGYVSPFLRYEQSLGSRFAISAIGEYTYAENDYPYELQNGYQIVKDRRTNSRMNSGHGELNFVWNTSPGSRLSGKVYYYDNDRQLPGQVRYYTNLSKETIRDQNFFGQLLYQTHNQGGWSLRWHAKFNWNASIYQDPLTPRNYNDASYWQREAYTSAAILYVPTSEWAFDYSADYSFNNLTGSAGRTINSRPYRHSVLQSATAKYRSGRLTALARLLYSLYLNDTKDGNSAQNMRRLSPSLSLSYKLFDDYDLYIRASYKNIFRSPTFNESYYFHYGSTDLEPESTDQYNLGVTWSSEADDNCSFTVTADGYYNQVKDMIVAAASMLGRCVCWVLISMLMLLIVSVPITSCCSLATTPISRQRIEPPLSHHTMAIRLPICRNILAVSLSDGRMPGSVSLFMVQVSAVAGPTTSTLKVPIWMVTGIQVSQPITLFGGAHSSLRPVLI